MVNAFENSEEKKRQCIDAFQRAQDEFFFDEQYTECIPRYIRGFISYMYRNKYNDSQINCTKFLKSIPVGTSNWTDMLQQWFACMCDKIFKNPIIHDPDIIKLRSDVIMLDKNNCPDYEKWNEKLMTAEILVKKFKKLEKPQEIWEKYRLDANPNTKRQEELKTHISMKWEENQIKNNIREKLVIVSEEHPIHEYFSNMWKGDTGVNLNHKINDITKIMIDYMINLRANSVIKVENRIKRYMANLFFVYSNLRLQEINKFEIPDDQKCSMGDLCEALETLVLDIDQLKLQMILKPDENPSDSDDPRDKLRLYMVNTFLKLFKSAD